MDYFDTQRSCITLISLPASHNDIELTAEKCGLTIRKLCNFSGRGNSNRLAITRTVQLEAAVIKRSYAFNGGRMAQVPTQVTNKDKFSLLGFVEILSFVLLAYPISIRLKNCQHSTALLQPLSFVCNFLQNNCSN